MDQQARDTHRRDCRMDQQARDTHRRDSRMDQQARDTHRRDCHMDQQAHDTHRRDSRMDQQARDTHRRELVARSSLFIVLISGFGPVGYSPGFLEVSWSASQNVHDQYITDNTEQLESS